MPQIAGNSQNRAYLDFKHLKIFEKSGIQLLKIIQALQASQTESVQPKLVHRSFLQIHISFLKIEAEARIVTQQL